MDRSLQHTMKHVAFLQQVRCCGTKEKKIIMCVCHVDFF